MGLLSKKSDIEYLIQAATDGDVSAVRKLISSGVDVKCLCDGQHALIVAAACGHVDVIRMLVEENSEIIDMANVVGEVALTTAADNEHLAVVNTLVELGADVDKRGYSERTALIEAAHHDDTRIARALIKAGASLNYEDDDGITALRVAKAYKNKEMFDLLESAGGKIGSFR